MRHRGDVARAMARGGLDLDSVVRVSDQEEFEQFRSELKQYVVSIAQQRSALVALLAVRRFPRLARAVFGSRVPLMHLPMELMRRIAQMCWSQVE